MGRDCPKCNQYLVENKKGKTTQVICSNCDYKEAAQNIFLFLNILRILNRIISKNIFLKI
ncbi:hypothetical protein ACVXZ0_14775 [Staphylococcus aureus]